MGYLDSAYWLDVGTPEAFVQGSCDLVLGRLTSPALCPGTACRVSGWCWTAPWWTRRRQVAGGTVVGADSVIETGAQVSGSVLFDGASVGAGAQVTDSVLGRGAQVGAGVVLDGVVIGDGARIGPGNELRAGLRVWPGWNSATSASGSPRTSEPTPGERSQGAHPGERSPGSPPR